MPARKIVLLGATGSIGTQTVDVVARLGGERARIVGLAARRPSETLAEIARTTGAKHVVATEIDGDDALVRLATLPEADTVVVAVAGAAALAATVAAARAGKRLCIATKEVLVAAGAVVTEAAKTGGAEILPIDSEHSALFQCLQGYRKQDVARLYLTASGGPFRTWPAEKIAAATIEDALNHPTWRMGGKITIDSATLMNKGLEIIEAAVLFGVPAEQVDVVIHPQSVIHSMVEMTDGALLAQLGCPDMRLPIQIALLHPEKPDTALPRLSPTEIGTLTFEKPDGGRFPALALARRAASLGGTAPAVLNAANEAAVAAFLDGRIRFPKIVETVAAVLDAHEPRAADSLETVLDADRWARARCNEGV